MLRARDLMTRLILRTISALSIQCMRVWRAVEFRTKSDTTSAMTFSVAVSIGYLRKGLSVDDAVLVEGMAELVEPSERFWLSRTFLSICLGFSRTSVTLSGTQLLLGHEINVTQ